jgi:hypothetical protein
MNLRVVWLLVGIGTFGHALDVPGQTRTAREVYQGACAACHGSDGSGAPAVESGYPVVPPDFRDCNFATREPAADWVGVSHHGGPNRAFSPLMPAFGEALSRLEIELAVSHARSFCTDERWPRGEVNFPRALFTTKAFPEDEAVLTVTVADGVVRNTFVYEQRIGPRSMFEIIAPLEFATRTSGDWTGGVGDLGFAFKHVLVANAARGSIVSAAAEVLVPTGSTERGIGSGTTVVEPFVAVGQRLPGRAFVHAQVGGGIPFDRARADEAFWRMAAGRSFRKGEFGRLWAPIVEVLGSRELMSGAATHWDVVPQLHVTLSTRQHIRADVGVRIPVNERAGRSTQFVSYFLWEWFNGGLTTGW